MDRKTVLAIAALALSGCAPVYLPSGMQQPMLNAKHQTHIAAMLVPGGGQVNAAHAVTERLAIKASGHQAESEHKHSRYKLATAGVTWRFGDIEPDGPITTVGADIGGGSSMGKMEILSTKILNKGDFLRVAVQADASKSVRWGAVGVGLRIVHFRFEHDAGSRAPGTTEKFWLGEPMFLFRVGPQKLRLEMQGGLSFPFHKSVSNLSGFVPIFASLGLTTNF